MNTEHSVGIRRIAKERKLNVGQQSIATVEPLVVSAIEESNRAELLEKATSRIKREKVKQGHARERKKSAGFS